MKKFTQKFIFGILVTGAALLASCGQTIKPGDAKIDHPVVAGAQVAVVHVQTVPDYQDAVGTLRSVTTSVVATKVMATVREVRVKDGDRVTAGQLLLILDDRDVAAQLAKARAGQSEVKQALAEAEQTLLASDANRKFASATYHRFKDLYEKKSVSPQEFEEVEAKQKVAEAGFQAALSKKSQILAKADQARADVAQAQVFVGYTRITSPLNGIVTAKQIEVGQMAVPGQPLMTVEDDSHYRLEASVEESLMGKIRVKDPVQVQIESLGSMNFAGQVAEVVPASDPASRTYTVRIDLSKPAPKSDAAPPFRSGLFGKARFQVGQKKALLVPQKAILERGQLVGVYVVDDSNIAQLRLIKAGRSSDAGVEILAGLNSGERIIVENVASVRDGSRVP